MLDAIGKARKGDRGYGGSTGPEAARPLIQPDQFTLSTRLLVQGKGWAAPRKGMSRKRQ